MSSPFESLPTTPIYERRNYHRMGVHSPSSSWMLEHGEPSSDLAWVKNHELSAMSALDALDLNDVLVSDSGTSSSSTFSDVDAFPAFGLHQMPAISTMAMARKAQHGNNASAGARAAGSVSRGVSPSNGISPSGLSDEDNKTSHGASFGGAMDDIWFMSSPTSLAMPSSSANGNLQRKKKMHFKQNLPSNRLNGESDAGGDRSLKPTKSMSQIERRVSSNYTSKLEDLLSEMGWPRQEGNGRIDLTEGEEEDGDTTIHAASGMPASGPSSFSSAPLQHSQSYAGYSQVGAQPYGGSSGAPSTAMAASTSLSSGLPAASSALFQRRAVAREGSAMPSPAPVAIPGRSRASDAPKTDGGVIPIRLDQRQQASPVNLFPHSAGLSASNADNTHSAPLSAQMLYAQSMALRGNSGNLDGIAGPSSMPQQMGSAGGQEAAVPPAAMPLFYYGAGQQSTRSSVGSSNSGLSGGSHPEQGQGRPQALPFGVSPVSTQGRSLTGSTMSTNTELLTPLTPFSSVPFGNMSGGPWSVAQPFDFNVAEHGQEGAMLVPSSLPTKVGAEPAAPAFPNALGLYQDTPELGRTAPALNPNAVIDPAAYAHLLSAGLIDPMDLSAATKFNRARASTAMAALDMPRSGPRAMRSQPNMRLTPPATASSTEPPLPFHTPQKAPRKIASNRRLNAGLTPETPSNAHLGSPGMGAIGLPQSPHSPLKRARSGLPLNINTTSFGTPARSGAVAFEFINYGIDDADELCSAVAPSGSYKIPLKGFGGVGGHDDDDDFDGNDSDDGNDANSPGEDGASPRRGRRRTKSTSNRNGPRWEEPPMPPMPNFLDGGASHHGISSTRSNNDVPLPPVSPMHGNAGGGGRKRRKSDANMLAGRLKSASMANLRK